MAYLSNKDWFQRVAEGEFSDYTYINKFGENPLITTTTDPEDMWERGGLYTFSVDADITQVASTDNGDTQNLIIYGLDENWLESTQVATLTGQTPVSLTTPLIRINRMINIGSTDMAGTVAMATSAASFASGVPSPDSAVRAQINNGNNQSLMAIHTIPADKTCYFWGGFVNITSGNFPTPGILVVTLRIRAFGGTFLLSNKVILGGGGDTTWQRTFPFPGVIPSKADILIRIESVTDDVGISGGFTCLLKDL